MRGIQDTAAKGILSPELGQATSNSSGCGVLESVLVREVAEDGGEVLLEAGVGRSLRCRAVTRRGAGAAGGRTTGRRGPTGWSVTRGAGSWTPARPPPRPLSTREETPGCSDGEDRDRDSEL